MVKADRSGARCPAKGQQRLTLTQRMMMLSMEARAKQAELDAQLIQRETLKKDAEALTGYCSVLEMFEGLFQQQRHRRQQQQEQQQQQQQRSSLPSSSVEESSCSYLNYRPEQAPEDPMCQTGDRFALLQWMLKELVSQCDQSM